jgi:hypothetical protein
MRLVLAGHDYYRVGTYWNLPMVMKANDAMDLQEEANAKAMRKAREQNGDG